jgi:pseudouridine synthase
VTVPLERALSKLGLATRSEARRLIRDGRVRVNGRTVVEPLTAVVPERIRIAIDDTVAERPARIVIALHKPRGVVTTRRDPEGRPTVYDLLADVGAHVVPVGRLDYATSGLLLLTNDTRLADWLTDPVNAVPRVYLATARGCVTDAQARQLEHGITVGSETLRARRVTIRKASNRETHLVVELVEGKNREVRRLFAAIDRALTRLRRVQFGDVTLGDLAPGRWRDVTAAFPSLPFRGKKLRTRATGR